MIHVYTRAETEKEKECECIALGAFDAMDAFPVCTVHKMTISSFRVPSLIMFQIYRFTGEKEVEQLYLPLKN